MSLFDKVTAQLPFTNKKPENTEYFLSLNVGLTELTAAVWAIFGREVDVLSTASISYKDNSDLLDKSLQVFDKALGSLEVDPKKVLFGVPETWNLDDNLKEPYLKLLQRILKECDLQPLAYVTTTNALSFALQKGESAPPTVIFLGVGDFVEATLVRGGKVVENRIVKRSDHLFDDMQSSLSQFTEVEVLPSRILLYSTKSGENLGKIHDELMSFPWVSKLPFLHFPKIEILEDQACTQAIISSAAFELNPEVDLKHSFVSKGKLSEEVKRPFLRTKSLSSQQEDATQKPVADSSSDKDLGFVKGDIKDRMRLEESEKSEDQKIEKQEDRVTDELEGSDEFSEDDNLIAPKISDEGIDEDRYSEEEMRFPAHQNASPIEAPEASETHHHTGKKNPLVSALTTKFSPIFKPLMPFLNKFKKLAMGKLILIPAILLVAALAYVFFVKASVTVFVEPRILEKDTEVVADPKASDVDEEKKIIPGTVVETTVEGSRKGTATGSKQIGDPAKGKVTIYNRTNSAVSLSQGTTLTSGNSLKFVLDASVKIASQSSTLGADLTTVIKPGKSDPVGVTAAAIGPDSNLSASTDTDDGLTVNGYSKSQVTALVTDALSGGTSKTVTVVTTDDQKKLQAQVLDEIRTKAVEDLKGKLEGEKKIISEALSVVDGKYKFNKQVNDAASEFTLTATVRFKGTAYSDTDLRTIVGKLVETNIPEGFQLNLQDTETQADVTKVEKDGRLIFKARFRAKMMPKYELEQIKKDIRGKSVDEVAEKLKKLENVLGSEIELTPSLPVKFARIPLLDRNINITITPK